MAIMQFDFALKYRIPKKLDADLIMERLAEAGCTDATVGVGLLGQLEMWFTRDANTLDDAVKSANADVCDAIPEAVLIQASSQK